MSKPRVKVGILNKRSKASHNSKDALLDFDKLSSYATSGSIEARKRALQSGITVTVIEDGYPVEIRPDGRRVKLDKAKLMRPSDSEFRPLDVRA